jgi:hypothetical protein
MLALERRDLGDLFNTLGRVAPPRATIITPTRRMPIVPCAGIGSSRYFGYRCNAREESHADYRIIAEGFY